MALRTKDGHADKGVSLARGPALVLGSILLTFGLLAFLTNGDTPTAGFADGTVAGEDFLGFEVNGWTAFFTAAAGGLLLFGAAQHLLAKTMSLVVGLALGACSVIALIDGDDVLGLAAANGVTALGWGIAAAVLLVNALLPRKGGSSGKAKADRTPDVDRERDTAPRRETVATHREERVTSREPIAHGSADARDERPADEQATRVDEVPATRGGRFDRGPEAARNDVRPGERPLDDSDPRTRA